MRRDIVTELRLRDPKVLVGSFDRPNLIYRVRPRTDRLGQVLAAIGRHRDQAGIVYCIRRSDVDELTAALARRGLKALRYHAGLSDEERRANQDAFINERVDIVVATVAFGMGIDRSNVRYVIHTGMPKSLEHYQQEAGRAGRDGLEAECLLLVSGADYGLWKSILTPEGAEPPPGALRKLGEMYAFCQQAICRHRALVTYFGQPYESTNCGACDVCLAETVAGEDTSEVTQKVLAAVAELARALRRRARGRGAGRRLDGADPRAPPRSAVRLRCAARGQAGSGAGVDRSAHRPWIPGAYRRRVSDAPARGAGGGGAAR